MPLGLHGNADSPPPPHSFRGLYLHSQCGGHCGARAVFAIQRTDYGCASFYVLCPAQMAPLLAINPSCSSYALQVLMPLFSSKISMFLEHSRALPIWQGGSCYQQQRLVSRHSLVLVALMLQDIDEVFDVGSVRTSLQARLKHLEVELKQVESLQRKFALIHSTLTQQSTANPNKSAAPEPSDAPRASGDHPLLVYQGWQWRKPAADTCAARIDLAPGGRPTPGIGKPFRMGVVWLPILSS